MNHGQLPNIQHQAYIFILLLQHSILRWVNAMRQQGCGVHEALEDDRLKKLGHYFSFVNKNYKISGSTSIIYTHTW